MKKEIKEKKKKEFRNSAIALSLSHTQTLIKAYTNICILDFYVKYV